MKNLFYMICASFLAFGSAATAANAIHPDLDIKPPKEVGELIKEIERRVDDLAKTSMRDIEAAKFSIPDYKVAYEAYELNLVEALRQYLAGLAIIQQKFRVPLSHLRALQVQAETDSTGLFKNLFNTEADRVIPPLNQEINKIYTELITKLYTLNSSVNIPFEAEPRCPHYRNCNNDRPNYTNQVDLKVKGSIDIYSSTSLIFFEKWDYTSSDTYDQTKVFNKCKTNACVTLLNKNIQEALDFAASLNQDINFAQVSFPNQIDLGEGDAYPTVARSMLLAAEKLLVSNNDAITTTFTASALSYAIKAPAGVALGFVAAPTAALESTMKFSAKVLGSTITQPVLKLSRLKLKHSLAEIKFRLNSIAKLYGSTLPAVIYEDGN